jgi:Ca2+-binding RTX toxin-like protein
VIVAAAALALAPSSVGARASVSCTYDAGVVSIGLHGDSVVIRRSGTAIDVNGAPCGVSTVDNTSVVRVNGAGGTDSVTIDLGGGPFRSASDATAADIQFPVDLAGGFNQLTVLGTASADAITLDSAGINLNASIDGGDDVVFASTKYMLLEVDALGGSDTVSAAGTTRADSLVRPLGRINPAFAGSGIGGLNGGPGNDHVTGGAGNDVLIGGPGDDDLEGGAGADTASFAGATAAVSADLATQTASDGDGGHDTLTSIENLDGPGPGAGTSTLIGDEHANRLSGTGSLSGGGGNDTLVGSGTLDGGAGSDRFLCLGSGDEAVAVSVDLSTGTAQGCEEGTVELVHIENATANRGCDEDVGCQLTITGDDSDNVLRVWQGGFGCICSATLLGRGGSDTLIGGSALNGLGRPDDVLRGGTGNDMIRGLAGVDELAGGPGRDVLHGGADSDNLSGGRGSDELFGGLAADVLNGGSGRDACNGGPGKDVLIRCE